MRKVLREFFRDTFNLWEKGGLIKHATQNVNWKLISLHLHEE